MFEPASLRIASILRALPDATGRGGVSYQVHALSQGLARRGHQVTVFSADPAPPGALYSVRGIAVPAAEKHRRRFWYAGFARLVSRQDFAGFDVIHAHGDNQFLTRREVPLVRTFWGSDLGEALADLRPVPLASHLLGYALEWIAGEHADRRVGISQDTRRLLPCVDEVVHPGVDLDVFRPGAGKSAAPSILYVAGTLGGRKRGGLLVECFQRQVLPAFPAAELWMVCPEKVEGPSIRWHATLPSSDAGTRELVRLYQQAWLFCLPSSYEGFGLPYVEAMACGTPVVATPNPGAREILEEGASGLLAAPEALGERLCSALGDAPLRNDLAARGLARVERFSLASAIARYESIFAALVAAARARHIPASR